MGRYRTYTKRGRASVPTRDQDAAKRIRIPTETEPVHLFLSRLRASANRERFQSYQVGETGGKTGHEQADGSDEQCRSDADQTAERTTE